MHVFDVLHDSIKALSKNPKLVIPQLISTFFYTIILLALLKITVTLKQGVDPMQAGEIIKKSLIILAALFITYLVDVYTYAMYPSLSQDYKKGREISLINAVKDVYSQNKTILAFSLILFVFLISASLTYSLLYLVLMMLQNTLFYYILIAATIAVLIAASILFFFIIPVAMIEQKGLSHSISTGIRLGIRHRKDLAKINLMFLALILTSMILIYRFEFQGTLATLALTAFIATRVLQAIVYAYICTANPLYYLHVSPSDN